MTAAPPLVEMRGVGRTFDSGVPVLALKEVDLTIERGAFLSIIGPSGSGKSTLLNILGLLDRPSRGTYLIGGLDTQALSESRRTALRARWFGFVFQAYHLLPDRRVLDNVALGMLYHGTPRPEREARGSEVLGRVGLAHRVHASPLTLSGGERQRVAIARAISSGPQVLLCDEPTGNLDRRSSDEVMGLLTELNEAGLSIVVITHDERVAERASKTVSVVDGVLVG